MRGFNSCSIVAITKTSLVAKTDVRVVTVYYGEVAKCRSGSYEAGVTERKQ